MSCNCQNIPCCCSSIKPAPVAETVCLDGEQCDKTTTSDCIIHDGEGLNCLGIVKGSTLTEIIQTLIPLITSC